MSTDSDGVSSTCTGWVIRTRRVTPSSKQLSRLAPLLNPNILSASSDRVPSSVEWRRGPSTEPALPDEPHTGVSSSLVCSRSMRTLHERPAMAVAGRAVVRVHPIMRAPPPRLVARCTPRAWPGAAMPSRMGGWSGIRSTRPAQRSRRAVLVRAGTCVFGYPAGIGPCGGKAASLKGAGGVEALSAARGGAGDGAEGGLTSKKQWQQWCREHRPSNIPSAPENTYATRGGCHGRTGWAMTRGSLERHIPGV